jgi:hypothetical protein
MFEGESTTESKRSNVTMLIVIVVVLALFLGITWLFTS